MCWSLLAVGINYCQFALNSAVREIVRPLKLCFMSSTAVRRRSSTGYCTMF